MIGSVVFFALARSALGQRHPFAQSVAAQVFDTVIVVGYVMVFAFERGLPVQQILYIDLAAACVRFGVTGGLIVAGVSAPILAVFAKVRADQLDQTFSWKLVFFQTFFEVLMALIVGWLVHRLAQEGMAAEARAEEAERLTRPSGARSRSCGALSRAARRVRRARLARRANAARGRDRLGADARAARRELSPEQRDALLGADRRRGGPTRGARRAR